MEQGLRGMATGTGRLIDDKGLEVNRVERRQAGEERGDYRLEIRSGYGNSDLSEVQGASDSSRIRS